MEEVVKLLIKHFKPISIFLYGSRARTDFLKRSDFEIGILFSKDNYVGRSEIKKVVSKKGFNIYPFEYEEFLQGKIDTPFQKKIYLRELILAGKTLYGEKVVEKMKAPQISIIDLIQDLRFNLGYALASIISHRNGDKVTASTEFYKSCLFATRTLIILKLRVFPLTYDEILKKSKQIDLGEYKELVEKAYKVRNGKSEYEDTRLFQNISYLNEFIEPLLLESFEKNSNLTLI
ncbi:nucleotidyltransferase domain-containing protein [Candidatus Woesearchaeota archaeon]|nr:nucleotidyltransferase domain-containing protein [Candidatus Woesearchaeota archaeon]